MRRVRILALMSLIACGVVSAAVRVGTAAQIPADQLADGISPEALVQIDALIAEKDARTLSQQKIDSQLIYEQKMESGQPIASGIWAVETDLPYASDGHLIVDIRAREGSALASRLPAIDVEVLTVSRDAASVRAHVNVDQIEAIAADPDVLFIQPRQSATVAGAGQDAATNQFMPTGQGSQSSEGDVAHLAFAARGAFHIDGAGVKIGVLSNGVANLAASQARGDLGPVTVLPGQTGTGDEGTAMLEIIHDLAPGAQLYFATGFTSITSFADNIRALRVAGCDIIVDDVFYFVESPFQDGQLDHNGHLKTTNMNQLLETFGLRSLSHDGPAQ